MQIQNADQFFKKFPLSEDGQYLREQALNRLAQLEFPNKKMENWKYTSLKEIDNLELTPAELNEYLPNHEQLIGIQKYFKNDFYHLVFFDGKLNETLSSDLPPTIHIKDCELEQLNSDDYFTVLNCAYLHKGIQIEVEKNAVVDKPVQIHHYVSSQNFSVLKNNYLEIIVGQSAQIQFVESFSGAGKYLLNHREKIQLGRNSFVYWVRLSDHAIHASSVLQADFILQADSNLHTLDFIMSGQLQRHEICVQLVEAGATAIVNGASILSSNQHADQQTLIQHLVGNCQTTQLYKNILNDESSVAFRGQVHIAPDAQKANSEQLNNNLLLSNKAEANSLPVLEIFADDVKATHGSTVGQLNKEEYFYLLSRAISPSLALSMLSFGFVADLVQKLEKPLIIEWLMPLVKNHFSQMKVSLQ